MFVNLCTVILLLMSSKLALQRKVYSSNVGTVLFTPKDVHKKHWTLAEISLLKARRHFQTILPPPGFINNFNDEYVNILLNYFKNSYSHIKREAADAHADTILTTALSDVLGGYLKQWINPFTKLGYYGGTVSTESAVKLFLFYDEIRKYLDTDGTGWHCPDEQTISKIATDSLVDPPKIAYKFVSTRDACEHIAYFEKHEDGLGIPLPKVHWQQRSSTMFVPLKNASLIVLNKPDDTNALIQYYETAKACIATSLPKERSNFDEKFQIWLRTNVMPHLRDDQLYLALRNVLSLVNKTNGFYGNFVELYVRNDHNDLKVRNHHFNAPVSNKKMIIIFLVLLIEVAWCVPALIYILCSKKKDKSNSNVYLYIDPGKPDKKDKISPPPPLPPRVINKNKCQLKLPRVIQYEPCVKLYKDTGTQRPTTPAEDAATSVSNNNTTVSKVVGKRNVETQCPRCKICVDKGTGSRTYFKSKSRYCEAIPKYTFKKRDSLDNRSQMAVNIQRPRNSVVADDSVSNRVSQPLLKNYKNPIRKTPTERSFLRDKTSVMKRYTDNDAIYLSKCKEHSEHARNYMMLNDDNFCPMKRSKEHILTQQNIESRSIIVTKKSIVNIDKVSEQVSSKSLDSADKCMKADSEHSKISLCNKQVTLSQYNVSTFKLPIKAEPAVPPEGILVCPCTACLQCDNQTSPIIAPKIAPKQDYEGKEKDHIRLKEKDHIRLKEVASLDTYKEVNEIGTSYNRSEKDFTRSKYKKTSINVNNSGKPYFKITIDRPATEIRLDMEDGKHENTTPAPSKRSKIPKRTTTCPQCFHGSKIPENLQPSNKQRSWIPQLKKKTVDDGILVGKLVDVDAEPCNLNKTI